MASTSAMERGAKRRGKKPWARREQGLKKKAAELSTLCGVDVFLAGYNDEGEDFFIWPHDMKEAERIADRLKEQQGIGGGQGPGGKRKRGASTSAPNTASKRRKGDSKAAVCPQNSAAERPVQKSDVEFCLDVLDKEEPMAFWREILEMTSGSSGAITNDFGAAAGANAIRPTGRAGATTGISVAAGLPSMIPPLFPPHEISDDLPVEAGWGASPWNGEYVRDLSAGRSWPYFQEPLVADEAFRSPSLEELLWGVPSMSGGHALEMEAQRSYLCSCQAAIGVPGVIPFLPPLLPPHPAAFSFSAANPGWAYF
ncbi:unnamed protein product [Spirodela intermedia]|uniref:MADS-box domain-containing protein n=1 Tax=Spirodela intermedia TaxID=51605 RepID=A0A7I8KQY3_SPIIN|nr:unnamed protein product [Spirodela intermedia]